MKIRIIHQYFKTPEDGGAIRSYHLAKYLKGLGHDISVITAYNLKKYERKTLGGITIHYLPIYYTNHLSFLSRIHAFLRFYWQAKKLMKGLSKPDINYVISTPLTTGLLGLYGLKKQQTPFMFEVGDLWPEAPIQLGVLKNPLLKWLSRKLERKIYNHARHIVGLSPDIVNSINKKTQTPTICVTNVSDQQYFKSLDNSSIKADLGYEDKFVVGYIGTVGLANHLEYLLEAAQACKNEERIKFVIMGGGAQYQAIKQKAKSRSLENIDFYPEGNKEQARKMLHASDGVYISFANAPILATGSPNKFFDGLAAGKLIIINFKGWIKKLIEDNACGFYHEPNQPESFLNNLKPYLENKNKLKVAQESASKLADSYSIENQFAKLKDVML